jgi:hypothetical protein
LQFRWLLHDANDNSCSYHHSCPNHNALPNYHPMPYNRACAYDGACLLQDLLLPSWVRREAQA